ncbi:MAG: hypothetical protein JNM56_18870 [Planctomycetia bacterium]|nr:hypothetical protein [Planctomycetia bacterium]
MESESAAPNNGQPAQGLPPVMPPSSRHIVQMFVVPGLIVGGVVLLGLFCSGAFGWMFGFGHAQTPEAFLQRLDDPNADVRWRAANDLVQVLKRDDELASNPDLGFKLAELLTQELDQIAFDEKSLAERLTRLSAREQEQERQKLKGRRDYVRFLSAALATMTLPVGVEPLKRMATMQGADPKPTAQMRRHAVWMLANLGDNLKRFKGDPAAGYQGLSAQRQEVVIARLQREADAATGQRRQLADQAVKYLKDNRHELGAIAALAECAKADDPDLRKFTAFALTFWDGSPNENQLAEQTLLALSHDDGRGVRIVLDEND